MDPKEIGAWVDLLLKTIGVVQAKHINALASHNVSEANKVAEEHMNKLKPPPEPVAPYVPEAKPTRPMGEPAQKVSDVPKSKLDI